MTSDKNAKEAIAVLRKERLAVTAFIEACKVVVATNETGSGKLVDKVLDGMRIALREEGRLTRQIKALEAVSPA